MDSVKLKNAKDFIKDNLGIFLKVFAFLYLTVLLLTFSVMAFQGGSAKKEFPGETKNILTKGESAQQAFVNKSNSIVISKIKIEAPLILIESTEPEDFIEPLKKGVVHYPSPLPGEPGETIILGHSAPLGWLKINYYWVFSELNKLESGDEIHVYFNNRQYRYLVEGKIFLQAGQETPSFVSDNSQSKLLLISCWPPGIDYKRIVVYSKLVN